MKPTLWLLTKLDDFLGGRFEGICFWRSRLEERVWEKLGFPGADDEESLECMGWYFDEPPKPPEEKP